MICFLDSLLEELDDLLAGWWDIQEHNNSPYDKHLHQDIYSQVLDAYKSLHRLQVLIKIHEEYQDITGIVELHSDDETVA